MPDEQNAGAAPAAGAEAGAEGASDNKVQAEAADAGAQDQANNQANQQEADKGKEGPDDADSDDSDEFVDDGKEEPPVQKRKSNADFIIARKNAKIAKLKEQQDAAKAPDANKSDAQADDDDASDDGDDDSVNLEGLAPIVQKHLEAEDAQEVAKFLEEFPDFKPFEAKAKRWMQHPSRRHLPVEDIFFAIAGRNMVKMGAERERKAREKAAASQSGGGSSRTDGQKPKTAWDMTQDEFEAEKLKVRQGR